jgi:spore coat polysaccharide biosynthesis protein SpsF
LRTVAIICARMGSKRLHGKVLKDLNGKNILSHIIRRANGINDCDVVIAFPKTEYDIFSPIMSELDLAYTAGSENDVLDRIIETAQFHKADIIYRITADNPILDSTVVKLTRAHFDESGADYAMMLGLPGGCAVEIFTLESLLRADKLSPKGLMREHPTMAYWVHRDKFKLCLPLAPKSFRADYRLTIDTSDDLLVMRAIFKACGNDVTVEQAIEFLDTHPEIAALNAHVEQEATVGPEFARKIQAN